MMLLFKFYQSFNIITITICYRSTRFYTVSKFIRRYVTISSIFKKYNSILKCISIEETNFSIFQVNLISNQSNYFNIYSCQFFKSIITIFQKSIIFQQIIIYEKRTEIQAQNILLCSNNYYPNPAKLIFQVCGLSVVML